LALYIIKFLSFPLIFFEQSTYNIHQWIPVLLSIKEAFSDQIQIGSSLWVVVKIVNLSPLSAAERVISAVLMLQNYLQVYGEQSSDKK
jgi:hypothetical protein